MRIAWEQLDLEIIDYQELTKAFADSGIIGLNIGLSEKENLVLFSTVNTEEAIGLIMRGLKELAGQDKR